MEWEELSNIIDNTIEIGTEIPKADGKTRLVTKKVGSKIYVRTGVKTKSEKYTTKEMIKYAYNTIKSGKILNSKSLKSNFPKEYSQGDCVFTMTGGILVLLEIARYVPGQGYINK